MKIPDKFSIKLKMNNFDTSVGFFFFFKPKHTFYQGLILYIFYLESINISGRYATKKNSIFDVTFLSISPYTDVYIIILEPCFLF